MVMLVFGLLMAVAMSYHKTLQTETMVQNNSSYSDRAMDAAFSGVNYAMALIQAEKSVFFGTNVYLVDKNDSSSESGAKKIPMDWISLNQKFDNYFDEERSSGTGTNTSTDTDVENENDKRRIPPYRFIVSCPKANGDKGNYVSEAEGSSNKFIYIKSMGQYIKYEDEDPNNPTPRENIDKKYTSQIIAKCLVDCTSKTIVLKSYKRIMVSPLNNEGYPVADSFFRLSTSSPAETDIFRN